MSSIRPTPASCPKPMTTPAHAVDGAKSADAAATVDDGAASTTATASIPASAEATKAPSADEQTASRKRASSAEAALKAKMAPLPDAAAAKAKAAAVLKEHHPLAVGDDSAEVKPEVQQLQQMLKDKGLYRGELTGKFDAGTERAVRAFQKQNGLKVDGIVGQQTWGALLGVKVPPGLTLLKPWARSFAHVASSPGVSSPVSAGALRDKAKAMYGQAFLDKLDGVAGRLGVSPDAMLKVMNNESGLRTDAVNPHGGATGLIQFMPSTAKGLGTTTAALKNMSAVEQLDYVEKYYRPYAGRLKNATDLYTVTFYPAMLGKPDSYVVGGSDAGLIARENPIFDVDKDGVITAQNFRDWCRRHFGEADVG